MSETPTEKNTISPIAEASERDSENHFEGEVLRITITNKEALSKTYHVHKDLFQANSPYFTAIIHFREGIENRVSLDDMDHDAFRQVLYWAYKGCFRDGSLRNSGSMIMTWVAADRLLMEKCKNMAMDEIRLILQDHRLRANHLKIVDDIGYSTDSTLVKYLIHQFSYDSISSGTCTDGVDDAQNFWQIRSEMAWALVMGLTKIGGELHYRKGGTRPKDPSMGKGCVYHDHAEGEKCYLPEPS